MDRDRAAARLLEFLPDIFSFREFSVAEELEEEDNPYCFINRSTIAKATEKLVSSQSDVPVTDCFRLRISAVADSFAVADVLDPPKS